METPRSVLLTDLPPELILLCAEYLPPPDAFRLSLTSKELRGLLTNLLGEMRECGLAGAKHYRLRTYLCTEAGREGHPRRRSDRVSRALPRQPLVEAVRTGQVVVVEKALLRFQQDPNSYDLAAKPLLHSAVLYRRLDIARLLLQHGADPNVTSEHGRTALDCWTSLVEGKNVSERIPMLELLLAHGAKPAQPGLLNEAVRRLPLGLELTRRVVQVIYDNMEDLNDLFGPSLFLRKTLKFATLDYVRTLVTLWPNLLERRFYDGGCLAAWAAHYGRVDIVAYVQSIWGLSSLEPDVEPDVELDADL
ncbi:uncharacterized protein BP01DRAFT_403900 [Aspergillus saccharolyticus JOP 1030-1]|uniref:F-box domain-containing protein n=1 Tax=Aspergillus saccharolyticus JOP 1030-1 TaxID=1450539 RepID=A0A318ZH28_9EURO|nr:hypothetical protein BP01DRAFT_403900 [Aspergillus saccharolyticus JOP 1030-1]PYH42980.1 hypothetical protein BP01DRAFT_403900 [Aspergillus saccharolyticus JOP 1030-1]